MRVVIWIEPWLLLPASSVGDAHNGKAAGWTSEDSSSTDISKMKFTVCHRTLYQWQFILIVGRGYKKKGSYMKNRQMKTMFFHWKPVVMIQVHQSILPCIGNGPETQYTSWRGRLFKQTGRECKPILDLIRTTNAKSQWQHKKSQIQLVVNWKMIKTFNKESE